jgi:hypothetical protein
MTAPTDPLSPEALTKLRASVEREWPDSQAHISYGELLALIDLVERLRADLERERIAHPTGEPT